MKKLYNLWILALTLIWAGACTPEVDDAFDQSAAHRINTAIAECQQILRSASNGWVLNYYPSSTQEYGGYTMLIRFQEDGMAQVSCDLFQADKIGTGLYDIENSAGPMLTFNTYNEIFHFFTAPANSLGIGENGIGMGGDSDFLIISCTNEEVVLKGKKTGNKMIMHPLPSSTTWTDYLLGVKKITQEAYPANYEVMVNGQVQYKVIQRYHKFILENADGSQVDLPFHYTQEGISFHKPLSLSTLQVKDLRWDKESMSFTHDKVIIRAQNLPKTYTRYAAYIGSYYFIYQNGDMMVPVAVEEELFNESFIMKGLNVDLRLRYNAVEGKIGLEYQELGDDIMLVPWSLNNGGKLGWRPGIGMDGFIEEKDITEPGSAEKKIAQIIRLKDNGVWGGVLTCDSYVAINASTGDDILRLPFVSGFYREVTVPQEPQQ